VKSKYSIHLNIWQNPKEGIASGAGRNTFNENLKVALQSLSPSGQILENTQGIATILANIPRRGVDSTEIKCQAIGKKREGHTFRQYQRKNVLKSGGGKVYQEAGREKGKLVYGRRKKSG